MLVPGPKIGGDAGVAQEVVVLRRDHAAARRRGCRRRPARAARSMSCGHERLVAGGLARHADDVHVVLDRVAGRLLGRLEQRAEVDVEAEVGERGGDHLGAAVVAVLAHLHDEHARPAALRLGERVDLARGSRSKSSSPSYARPYTPVMLRISARWRPNTSSMASVISPTVARARAASIAEREQVAVAGGALASARSSAAAHARVVAVGADAARAGRSAARAPRCCRCRGRRRASSSSGRYLLTPTMTSSPRSTRAWRRAAASSMRSFGMPDSTALVMPPSASTSSMSAHASSASACGERLDVVAAAERVDDVR